LNLVLSLDSEYLISQYLISFIVHTKNTNTKQPINRLKMPKEEKLDNAKMRKAQKL